MSVILIRKVSAVGVYTTAKVRLGGKGVKPSRNQHGILEGRIFVVEAIEILRMT